MKKSGLLKKLNSTEAQVSGEKGDYRKFRTSTMLPAGVLSALEAAGSPIEVHFHINEQRQLVQGEDYKYLIWLPGEEEPAMPKPRPAPQRTAPPKPQAGNRNYRENAAHGGGQNHNPHQGQQGQQNIPYTIDQIDQHRTTANKIDKLTISFHRKMIVREHGQEILVDTRENTDFQVTDPGLAFRAGAQFSRSVSGKNPGLAITSFPPNDPELPSDIRGTQLNNIDRNPYNFVSLPGNTPWLYDENSHPDHEKWQPNLHTGVLDFTAKAETPLFVPEGFPFSETGNVLIDEQLRTMSRHFCRMKNASGETRYAVPGASVKGAVRTDIEALTNSRMGVLNKEYYEKKIPYRRRCFNHVPHHQIQTGIVEQQRTNGDFMVTKIKETYIQRADLPHFKGIWGGGPDPTKAFSFNEIQRQGRNLAGAGATYKARHTVVKKYEANLMNKENTNHIYSHRIITRMTASLTLPDATVTDYKKNLEHPHFETHWKEYLEHAPTHPGTNKPDYINAVSQFPSAKTALDLVIGDIIYFTDDGTNITSFGKNVNYLWPANHSIKGLIADYFLPEKLGLGMGLSMAERLFGFAGKHQKTNGQTVSHPFRSRLSFETMWGPRIDPAEGSWTETPADDRAGFKVKLAPLTSPQARAKARPLYLEPGDGGRSASYSDGAPVLRGRKFYWHQKTDDQNQTGIWSIHKRHPYHDLVEKQLPPEIYPLKPGSVFKGRIHFENLTDEELGALLYSLSGDGTYRHGIKMGKGKPRGLGSMSITISKLSYLKPDDRYTSLNHPKTGYDVKEGDGLNSETSTRITDFKTWCATQNSGQNFDDQNHIKDYKNLHRLPDVPSSRYYPLNFSQYSWLPVENKDPDEPKPGLTRPKAMEQARKVNMIP